jgi:hypothetical protein
LVPSTSAIVLKFLPNFLTPEKRANIKGLSCL